MEEVLFVIVELKSLLNICFYFTCSFVLLLRFVRVVFMMLIDSSASSSNYNFSQDFFCFSACYRKLPIRVGAFLAGAAYLARTLRR